MTEDEKAIHAYNVIAEYCTDRTCSDCVVGDKCFSVRKDGYMPDRVGAYADVRKKVETFQKYRQARKCVKHGSLDERS